VAVAELIAELLVLVELVVVVLVDKAAAYLELLALQILAVAVAVAQEAAQLSHLVLVGQELLLFATLQPEQ
jgi:hypothetical protein